MDILTSKETRASIVIVTRNAEVSRPPRVSPAYHDLNKIPPITSTHHDSTTSIETHKKTRNKVKEKTPPIRAASNECTRSEHRYLAKAMATFEADPSRHDLLSVARFEVLEVQNIKSNFWKARNARGEIGLVPQDYLCLFDANLTMYEASRTLRAYSDSKYGAEKDAPIMVKAVFPYLADPSNPYEISFKRHEILEVTENVPGWWNARKENGETGVVPSPYFVYAENAKKSPPSLPPPPPYRNTGESTINHEPIRRPTQWTLLGSAMERIRRGEFATPMDPEYSSPFHQLDDLAIAQAVWCASI